VKARPSPAPSRRLASLHAADLAHVPRTWRRVGGHGGAGIGGADRVGYRRHRLRRAQLFDFATAQGLSSTEPKGYFAEVNPLIAQIDDPVIRQYVGFALKVGVVIFVIGVARLQRRRALGVAILLVGTVAGLFGAWSNMNPWR
jgi:hypothetical protein